MGIIETHLLSLWLANSWLDCTFSNSHLRSDLAASTASSQFACNAQQGQEDPPAGGCKPGGVCNGSHSPSNSSQQPQPKAAHLPTLCWVRCLGAGRKCCTVNLCLSCLMPRCILHADTVRHAAYIKDPSEEPMTQVQLRLSLSLSRI